MQYTNGRGTDRKLNLERIAKVIQESKADLIGLNEVDRYFSKRDSTMLRQYGNAFLSRYPIVLEKNHLFTFNRFTEDRSLLEIRVQLHKQLLKVYVTHVTHLCPIKD